MDEQTRQLRTEARLLARGRAPRGIRYSAAFRRRAIALVRERARQGRFFGRKATHPAGEDEPSEVADWASPPAPRVPRHPKSN
jgi:hypothetical protein